MRGDLTRRVDAAPSTDVTYLVDALVEAVDTDREDAVERVRAALEPFGASILFATELRLNGRSSEQVWAMLADWTVF